MELHVENHPSERFETLKLKLRQRWRKLKALRPRSCTNMQKPKGRRKRIQRSDNRKILP